MVLEVYFNNQKTTIEILDTPIGRLWARAYKEYTEKGYSYKAETVPISVHSNKYIGPGEVNPLNGLTQKECIELLNKAIDDVNSYITGTKFPYTAYEDMPWSQGNRIHRAFTTASSTRSTWFHNFTLTQLKEFKKISYSDKAYYMRNNCPTMFEILDEEKFVEAAERINHGVHLYETFLHSKRAKKAEETVGRTDYIELDWTNQDRNFARAFFYGNRISYEELKISFPDNYSDYDVFVGKMVEGKDYEFAYCEYDDGLEYDITNLDWICGDLRIHYNKSGNRFYTDTQYRDWIDDLEIEDEMHLPVPLGRIVSTESDFSTVAVDYNSEVRLVNGNCPLVYPFNKITTKLVE